MMMVRYHGASKPPIVVCLLALCLSVAIAQCSPSGLPSPSEGDDKWGLAGKHERVKLLTAIGGSSEYPAWSPDGTQIAFQHIGDRTGEADIYDPRDIYVIAADGAQARRVTHGAEQGVSCEHPSWAPDSRRLVCACDTDGDMDLYVLDTISGELSRLTDEPGDERHPVWSPDGAYVAFTSSVDTQAGIDGRSGAYVLGLERGGIKQVATTLGYTPLAWSPDSQRIAYTPWQAESSGIPLCTVRLNDGRQTCWPDRYCFDPTWSPDGSAIGCISRVEIEAFNLQTEQTTTLLDTEFYILSGLSWSADSKRLVFAAGLMAGAANDLYLLEVEP